jgi:hypothetical protein
MVYLINWVKGYKRIGQKAGYYEHVELIKKHKIDFVYLKNKKMSINS